MYVTCYFQRLGSKKYNLNISKYLPYKRKIFLSCFIMNRNIEIKATLRNKQDIISKLKSLTKTDGEIIKQHDIFYTVPNGRLKARNFADGSSELIHYERPDTEGPKLSQYLKYPIKGELGGSSELLQNILRRGLGINGEVKKTRHLFLYDQTRVHVDSVENLGDFIELEVVLNESQSAEDGQQIAHDIMKILEISESDLHSQAYVDMLNKK